MFSLSQHKIKSPQTVTRQSHTENATLPHIYESGKSTGQALKQPQDGRKFAVNVSKMCLDFVIMSLSLSVSVSVSVSL